jgi:thioredoxin 2
MKVMPASRHVVCPDCAIVNRVPAERPADAAKCGNCRARLFQGRPVELTAATFDRHLTQYRLPLLVDFWAPWCGPCKAMAPVLEAAAKELELRLRVAKLDTDAVPEVAARYEIRSIPTLILFKAGREAARIAGAMPPAQLKEWLEPLLRAP